MLVRMLPEEDSRKGKEGYLAHYFKYMSLSWLRLLLGWHRGSRPSHPFYLITLRELALLCPGILNPEPCMLQIILNLPICATLRSTAFGATISLLHRCQNGLKIGERRSRFQHETDASFESTSDARMPDYAFRCYILTWDHLPVSQRESSRSEVIGDGADVKAGWI
jgi:hypothetical protein